MELVPSPLGKITGDTLVDSAKELKAEVTRQRANQPVPRKRRFSFPVIRTVVVAINNPGYYGLVSYLS
jgi:hypothetical protein